MHRVTNAPRQQVTDVVREADLTVTTLGTCRVDSPLRGSTTQWADDADLILFDATTRAARMRTALVSELPGFEPAGPRQKIFFEPSTTRAGIVRCGGLCPGINDVIRALVIALTRGYGVTDVVGFRNGYRGIARPDGLDPIRLDLASVRDINQSGGSILGVSRGAEDPCAMVDHLQRSRVKLLFVIGGDGTMRGAQQISNEAHRRNLDIAIVGIPKTIDNDIPYVDQSFGFQTAAARASDIVRAAQIEATAAPNGVGLVKVMGRHSGFIACHAALAKGGADFVLVPEVRFELDGPGGLLAHLRRCVQQRGHAVIVAAEGAGQELLTNRLPGFDRSGNAALGDVGHALKARIEQDFAEHRMDLNLRYIDPGYGIRGVPADPNDSIYCIRLAHAAVHAALARRTGIVIGRWRGLFMHVPMALVVSRPSRVDPSGDLWNSVLEATGQPHEFSPAAGVLDFRLADIR